MPPARLGAQVGAIATASIFSVLALAAAACSDSTSSNLEDGDAVTVDTLQSDFVATDLLDTDGPDAEVIAGPTVADRCRDISIANERDCGCLDTATTPLDDAAFDCLICGMHACRDVSGGFYQGLGFTYLASMRYATDMCYFTLTAEVEGEVTVYACGTYPGFAPWPELLNTTVFPPVASDRSPYCNVTTRCSVLDPSRPCPSGVLGCGF